MADRKLSMKDKAAAAAFVIVLGISSILGVAQRGNASGRETAAEERSAAGGEESPAGKPGRMGKTGTAPDASLPMGGSGQTDWMGEVPVLSQEQTILVGSIMEALKQGNLEQAAGIMNREEDALWDMFYTVMKGQRYLFDGKALSQDIEGQGMVFTKAGTVFYGSFQNGKPEGACTALQAVNLEAPRYDYSEGEWKAGKMNGPGCSGYSYYENSPEDEAGDIRKSGTFSDDFLDGEVVYTSRSQGEEAVTWKFTVNHGVVVLDARWQYVKASGEYQLLSEEDDSRGYVVGENQITLPVWKNLLVWEE